MNSSSDSTAYNLIKSSLWGTFRGISVEIATYPLEVVKIRQQCTKDSQKSMRIARQLLSQEGFGAFYRGLLPQLIKTSLRQVWCWPMITEIPRHLQSYGIGDIPQHIFTGVSIATVDAAVTTPLERAKILLAMTGKIPFSLGSFYKEGWQGFVAYWTKRSINMVSFLTAQKYLRELYRKDAKQLSLLELSSIGIQVALIVSLLSAPFDIANTLKQTQSLNFSSLFFRQKFSTLYRGWPLHALVLAIHNVASVIVIEKLTSQ